MKKQKEYPVTKPMYNPPHPGAVLKEMFMKPMKIKIIDAAAKLNIDRTTLSRFMNGHISVSLDMALRLSKALDTTPRFWLNMQHTYDLAPVRKLSIDLSRVQRFKNTSTATPLPVGG